MRRFRRGLPILISGGTFILCVVTLFAQRVDDASRSIAITNVTVVDVRTGELRNGITVVTKGERIAAMGGRGVAIPRNATRVNGKGKYLIPGLWDMHSHHQASGADWTDLFVAKGITGTRDMGSDLDFILPLRERVRSGAVLGPEIVAAGPILDDAPPSYPFRRRLKTAKEARDALADLKRAGVDFIKVHDHTPREVFFAIAEEAPRLGLTFAGHVPFTVKIDEAAGTGMRSIEHLSNYEVFGQCLVNDETYSLEGCRPLFEKLAKNGVWQTPTLAFFQALPDMFSGSKALEHAEYASDSLLQMNHDNAVNSKVPASTLAKMRLAGDFTVRQIIRDLHSTGNQFLAGCDGLVPGFCLHDELEWFTKAGLTPVEALQTATINPARFFGREATQGTVEAGKRADLVLVDANPLVDIRNVARIESVLVRGRLVGRQEIQAVLAGHLRKNPGR